MKLIAKAKETIIILECLIIQSERIEQEIGNGLLNSITVSLLSNRKQEIDSLILKLKQL